jgi:hypothetical protein
VDVNIVIPRHQQFGCAEKSTLTSQYATMSRIVNMGLSFSRKSGVSRVRTTRDVDAAGASL